MFGGGGREAIEATPYFEAQLDLAKQDPAIGAYTLPEISGLGPGFIFGVRGRKDTEATGTVISGIDQHDFASKSAYRDRGPANELDGGPAFELQPNFVADMKERHIVAGNPEFHHGAGSIGNENSQILPGLE